MLGNMKCGKQVVSGVSVGMMQAPENIKCGREKNYKHSYMVT